MSTLEILYTEQAGIESSCEVETCQARDLQWEGEWISRGKDQFRVSEEALEQVPGVFGIHRSAFRLLSPSQQRVLIEYSRNQNPDQELELAFDREAVLYDIRHPGEPRFSSSEVLQAVMDSVPQDVDARSFPARWDSLSPVRLHCTIVSSHVEREVRPGDCISAGLRIIHPGSDTFLPKVRFYLERLVCSNGLTITQSTDHLQMLRRQLGERELPPPLLKEKLRSALSQAWQAADIPLRVMQELQDEPVAAPLEAIDALAERLRFSDEVRHQIRESYREDELGPNSTRLGVLNAFTRTITHGGISPGNRIRLERAAERIFQAGANRCPACRAFFTNSHSRREK